MNDQFKKAAAKTKIPCSSKNNSLSKQTAEVMVQITRKQKGKLGISASIHEGKNCSAASSKAIAFRAKEQEKKPVVFLKKRGVINFQNKYNSPKESTKTGSTAFLENHKQKPEFSPKPITFKNEFSANSWKAVSPSVTKKNIFSLNTPLYSHFGAPSS